MWELSDSTYRLVTEQQKARRRAAEQARLANMSQRRRWWKRWNAPQAR